MNQQELKNKLQQAYSLKNWKEIISFVFPNVSYLRTPQNIYILDEKIKEIKQVGEVKLHDGKKLAILDVKVDSSIDIAKSKVRLRDNVSSFIDQEQIHGVLATFDKGEDNFRFTFVAKETEYDESLGDFVVKETDKKRYTYVLGKSVSSRTPRDRFWDLKEIKDTATIQDVELAFSVESLTNEFFNRYKEHYENFVQYITGKRFVKQSGKWTEKIIDEPNALHKEVFNENDKDARNFVKLMLGRLIFIQFLQKKGWMGVAADNKEWKNGEAFFTHKLFDDCSEKEKFHSKRLYPLFFSAFNKADRPNSVFDITGTKVPYLNGGLFEEGNENRKKINFPPQYFEELFDFFAQYNFTIDENDPDDKEIGIDPEMLGHIFENLLEDNKDKGAFYTPKAIVQYMGQESLVEYLKTYLKTKKQTEITEELEQQLQDFVKNKKIAELINHYDEELATALKEVKICDPAIGSGAFPMGLLNEIYRCVNHLYYASPDVVGEIWEMETWQASTVKKNIIQHSIYGVDIEKGAVDIARLRFWLSLIVDEEEPTPLPNLDYKIMQGNSLLESFEGIDLSNIGNKNNDITIVEPEKDLFGNIINSQMEMTFTKSETAEKTQELIEKYFNETRPKEKDILKKQIEIIVHEHIEYNIELKEKNIYRLLKELESGIKKKKVLKRKIAKTEENKLNKLKTELAEIENKRQKLEEVQNEIEKPYFLWHLFFKDVFDEGGFDIVIGNPPYIQLQKMVSSKKNGFEKYQTYSKSSDIYALFYELGFNILNENGVLSYITSNSWLRTKYGKLLRGFFAEQTNPIKLLNFEDMQIFQTAIVESNILISQKSSFKKNLQAVNFNKKYSKNDNFYNFFKSNKIILTEIDETEWTIASPEVFKLKRKIENNSVLLGELNYKITYGIRSGLNEVFIIDQQLKEQLVLKDKKNSKIIKPLLRGRDLNKFDLKFKDLWVILSGYKQQEKLKNKYPVIAEYLTTFETKLKNRGQVRADSHHWLELDNSPTEEYFSYFKKPKIIWIVLSDKGKFAYDEEGFYTNDSCFIMTGDNLKFLLAILNSNLANWYFSQISTSSGMGTNMWKKYKVEQLPIKELSKKAQKPFTQKVDKILQLKEQGKSTTKLEAEIDQMVYKLYNLTEEEIELIEGVGM